MKNKRNAFTLIELLSVIVIFAITFLIVVPTMNSLIGNSERREIELIEQRVLSAAKEYVNNFDGSFYTNFYKEGDTGYVYKSDLINAELIDENEISKLNTFAGVKGELLSNERIRYTVEYINASNNEYTNEELYLMIKNLQNQGGSSGSGNTNSEAIEELQNQIYVDAGLPNITGTISNHIWTDTDITASGAFIISTGTEKNRPVKGSSYEYSGISFDASKSNAIYGNSETVQPNAYVVYMWKRTA